MSGYALVSDSEDEKVPLSLKVADQVREDDVAHDGECKCTPFILILSVL